MAFVGGSIGSGEVLLILAVALVIFGPHKLPGIARTLGRWMNELRRSAREFSDELTRATLDNTPGTEPSDNKGPAKASDPGQNAPK